MWLVGWVPSSTRSNWPLKIESALLCMFTGRGISGGHGGVVSCATPGTVAVGTGTPIATYTQYWCQERGATLAHTAAVSPHPRSYHVFSASQLQ